MTKKEKIGFLLIGLGPATGYSLGVALWRDRFDWVSFAGWAVGGLGGCFLVALLRKK